MNSKASIKSSLVRLRTSLGTLSLRSKLIIANILITTFAIAALGFYNYLRAQRTQVYLSGQLDANVHQQAEETLQTTVSEQANALNNFFTSISGDVVTLNKTTEALLPQKSAFSSGSYWDASQSLSQLPNGSWDNPSSDAATIFMPADVKLTPSLVTDLNTIRQLDFLAPNLLEKNSNITAIYFGGKYKETIYYPNIDLASLVPSDFDITQRSWFVNASPEKNPEKKVVWSDPYLDAAQNGLIVTVSTPVFNGVGQFRGVVAMDIQLNQITDLVSKIHVGDTGYAFLIDKDKRLIAMPSAAYLDFGISPEAIPLGISLDEAKTGTGIPDTLWAIFGKMSSGETGLETIAFRDTERFVIYQQISETGYSLGIVVPSNELLKSAATAQNQIAQETKNSIIVGVILVLGILLFSILAFFIIGNGLMQPLKELSLVAESVAAGNLTARSKAQSKDEIGSLANTFNHMTSQLQEMLQGLEQRVAARTRNLELAAEVGRTVSQVRDLSSMLKDASELVLKEFDLYYVQVYLTDPSQRKLVLEAGTGDVGVQLLGRGHSLPLNTGSLNGRAAVEKTSVVIPNTAQSSTFRKNPLLPETRGEMAVPLIVGDRVVGVLDMQSSAPGVLTEEILPAFEALAGQMAVAIQNANLLAETEKAHAQVETQARRLVREGWNEHLNAIHKPERIGFVFDHNQVTALADMDEIQLPENEKAITASISVTGESLGSLSVEIDDESQREQTNELVAVVARQVAQQIENLRLLESAERYRHEAEQAARLQTVEGWQKYISSRNADSLGYMYDLKEVRPYANGNGKNKSMFALPLKARDEKIGNISVEGLTLDNKEEVELANVVAERLSAHIESLRLFEETKQGQVELTKRARQLSSVAEISTASSQELDVDKLLSTVVKLTQRQFDLYHAHVFIFNEATEELQIAACGWQEGDEHEGTTEHVSIPLDKKQSLVARAARTKSAVIVNDVKSEPGWLANELLPNTAAEMAVPLVIGDRVLGVLDVQADHINAFTDEDANIQTTLASQVATAMQNARSFTTAQKQAERESMLNTINQKIQSATSVEAVLQIAARELGHALGAPMAVAQLSMKDKS